MALILDTGVVYAALDRSDPEHVPCRRLIEGASEQLIVPSPALVEIDYLVTKAGGVGAMLAFLRDVRAGAFLVEDLLPEDYGRIYEILDRYADQDIGFVDAAVLAVVERLDEPKLATLDRRHFSILRPRHRKSLQLLPRV